MSFNGKTILVTGAGGSIGSSICRALEQHKPKLLILFELNEYALYMVDQDLSCNRLAVLGDVKDKARLDEFMNDVDIVFHCAAYKHVPMCQAHNAMEAHKNNYIGTVQVLESAKNAQAVVLLSTDKAIKPSCAMGNTKYLAECAALHYGRSIARLGNILESSGSVIPKFRKQIETGGPVTVTHPETTRYFIEMHKAVEFILSVAEKTSGAYMIDMGEPRKILDIAKEMIGDQEISIEFIGLRPGEKLHEDIQE